MTSGGPERGGLHPDPDDPHEPAPDPSNWTPLLSEAATGQPLECFRDALRFEGNSVRAGVIADLAEYYGLDADEVVHRCVHWEEWSTKEWQERSRTSNDDIADFYRTTASWSFDLLWFAYLQAEMYRYPVSAVIATVLADELPPGARHLDFGCGVGVTSQMFSRLGYTSEMADISTSMLQFATFRLQRRGDEVAALDLNDHVLEPDRYDVITAIDTLVHIPDLERVLRQLHASLRPGGVLFANFATRPQTAENSQFLYADELPLRRLIQRIGFEPEHRLDGMITKYRRVEPHGLPHFARRVRDAVLLSPLRPWAKRLRDRVRRLTHR